MLLSADCFKSHMFIVIPRATTTTALKRHTLKNSISQDEILKKFQVTQRWQEERNRGMGTIGNKQKKKKKTKHADISTKMRVTT